MEMIRCSRRFFSLFRAIVIFWECTLSEALSGIGLKKAEAIVKYRTEKGLFKTAEDLTNVKGIGEKTIAKNKKDILVSDAPAVEPKAVAEPKKDAKSK